MAELTIGFPDGKTQLVKLPRIATQMRASLRKGLTKAGQIVEKSAGDKIKGPGFTLGNRSRQYPGVLTGLMFQTLTSRYEDSGPRVRIGPNVEYAAYQEFGTSNIEARPFMGDSLKENVDEITDAIRDAVMGSFDGR